MGLCSWRTHDNNLLDENRTEICSRQVFWWLQEPAVSLLAHQSRVRTNVLRRRAFCTNIFRLPPTLRQGMQPKRALRDSGLLKRSRNSGRILSTSRLGGELRLAVSRASSFRRVRHPAAESTVAARLGLPGHSIPALRRPSTICSMCSASYHLAYSCRATEAKSGRSASKS